MSNNFTAGALASLSEWLFLSHSQTTVLGKYSKMPKGIAKIHEYT